MLVLFFLLFSSAKAQVQTLTPSTWTSVGEIYNNGTISVNLEYKLAANICNSSSTRKSKWRYLINGSYNDDDFYINWKMDYLDCNGKVITLTNYLKVGSNEHAGLVENLDWDFAGYSVEPPFFYDVNVSDQPDLTKPKEKKAMRSTAAQSISGNKTIVSGQLLQLAVEGGELGTGATWVWYSNNCGAGKIGEGETIDVQPTQTTTYFVRAEGKLGNTDCVSAKVLVDNNSYPAAAINGPAKVCQGQSAALTVSGGKLGLNANWYWYENNCNGTPIGEGETVVVYPDKETTYFVLAKGESNTTVCRQLTIMVDKPYQNPATVNGGSTVCPGGSTQLTLEGGDVSGDGKWVWYANSFNTSPIGYGRSIAVNPVATTTFMVRGEGSCPSTQSLKKEVHVGSASQAANSINVTSSKNYKYSLSVSGGELGDDAEWIWYRKSVAQGKMIGKGAQLDKKITRDTRIYLRAEGRCNSTDAVSLLITPKKRRYVFLNAAVVGKDMEEMMRVKEEVSNISITLGVKKNLGWYIRSKFNVAAAPQTNLVSNDNKEVSNYSSSSTYFKFNGVASVNRLSGSGGLLMGSKVIVAYLGAGYGIRELYWQIDEYSLQGAVKVGTNWVKNMQSSYKGPEAEGGLLLRIGSFNIMGGASRIYDLETKKNFTDFHAGVGLTF